ncbi:Ig-like domain-containing protein [bacterium]|nr:Ig-like domain-containing protein [bacterium]
MEFANSLSRKTWGQHWLGFCIFTLALLVSVLLPGCGGSGSSGGGAPQPREFSNVIFKFDNFAQVDARAVPEGTTSVRFTGHGENNIVTYGPNTENYAATITLEGVPVTTTGFVLEYLGANGSLQGLYSVKCSLSRYEDTYITISETKSISQIVKSINLTPSSMPYMGIGMDESVVATAVFNDGQVLDVTKYMTWTSSDESVAKVNDEYKVAALAGGTCIITGTLEDVTSSELTVTVDPGIYVTGLVVSPSEIKLPLTATRTITVSAHYSDGRTKVVKDANVTVDKEELLNIKDNGNGTYSIKAQSGAGGKTATITATSADGKNSAQCVVNISNAKLVSIEISRTNQTPDLKPNQIYDTGDGSIAQFKAEGTYDDGDIIDITPDVNWKSTDNSVAKFEGAVPGALKGVDKGTVTVSASLDGKNSNTVDIEVVYAGVVELKFNISDDRILTYINDDYKFTVTATYANGKKVNYSANDDIVYTYCRSNGVVGEGFVTVTKDVDNESAILVGNKLTADSGYLRASLKSNPDVDDKIDLVIIEDEVKYVGVKIVDNLGREWALSDVEGATIGLPIGRTYNVQVTGENTSGSISGDITGNCKFTDSFGFKPTERSVDYPVMLMGKASTSTEEVEAGYVLGSCVIDSQHESAYYHEGQDGKPVYFKDIYEWESEDLDATPARARKDSGTEEEHEYYNRIFPQNTVYAYYKGKMIFQINFKLVRPAIDMYVGAMPDKGRGTARDVLVYKTDYTEPVHFYVPRGTVWERQYYAAYSDQVDRSLEEKEYKDVSDKMQVDEESYSSVPFMLPAEDDVYKCDKWDNPTEIGTVSSLTVRHEEEDREKKFGGELGDGSWKSFHVPCLTELELCTPLVLNGQYQIKIGDGEYENITEDKYTFGDGDEFTLRLINVRLSDEYDIPNNDKSIDCKYKVSFGEDSDNRFIIAALKNEIDYPGVFVVSKSIKEVIATSGSTNTVAANPNPEQFFNYNDWLKKISVVLEY